MDINSSCQEIAGILSSNIHSISWKKSWISGDVNQDHTSLEYGYTTEQKLENWLIPDFNDTNKVSKKLLDIRAQMTVPGQAPWSRCTFTLFPDGKFKFDVEYDD
jgi:hypothetical protein